MHEIIKFPDKIIIESWLFISQSINFDLPSISSDLFTFSSDSFMYKKSYSSIRFLKVNIPNTKRCGREALINSAISSCNEIEKRNSYSKILRGIPSFKLKSLLAKHFLETYISH